MLVDSTSTHLAQLGALSSNGRSKTFDASADGYGRGEACIVFVARRPAGGQAALAVMHGEKWLYRAIREGLGGSCAAVFALIHWSAVLNWLQGLLTTRMGAAVA